MSTNDAGAALRSRAIALPFGPALVLALASATAGLIHLAFAGEHFQEYVPFGLFFLASGAFQLIWAVMVFSSRSRTFFAVGLVANAAFGVLWAATRITGLPIGPEHWAAEAVGTPDVACTVLEATVVLGCAWILRPVRALRPA